MKIFTLYIAFSICSLTIVQAKQLVAADSLVNKDFEYFEGKVIEHRRDTAKAKLFSEYWLKKALDITGRIRKF